MGVEQSNDMLHGIYM